MHGIARKSSSMDTLGFEPRASAYKADVMPLHHVPSHVLFVIHVYTACFVLPHLRGFANLFSECCRLLVLQRIS